MTVASLFWPTFHDILWIMCMFYYPAVNNLENIINEVAYGKQKITVHIFFKAGPKIN